MKKVDNAKIQKIASVFRDFLCFCVTKIKSEKTRLGAAVQQGGIKIGGSGGGWKSRLKCVDGCSNRVTVREIALVVFYYSTSSEVGRLAAAHMQSKAISF